jgi:hypothetical protein
MFSNLFHTERTLDIQQSKQLEDEGSNFNEKTPLIVFHLEGRIQDEKSKFISL